MPYLAECPGLSHLPSPQRQQRQLGAGRQLLKPGEFSRQVKLTTTMLPTVLLDAEVTGPLHH